MTPAARRFLFRTRGGTINVGDREFQTLPHEPVPPSHASFDPSSDPGTDQAGTDTGLALVAVRAVTCSHTEKPGELSGLLVRFDFPDEEPCEGAVSFCAKCRPDGAWELQRTHPLTIQPSVACSQHPHHHGYITDGKWVWA